MKPVPANILVKRLAQFRANLDKVGVDVALISHPKHVYYLSGWMPLLSPSFLLVDQGKLSALSTAPVGDLETDLFVDYDIWHGWDTVENVCRGLQIGLSRYSGRKIALGAELAFLPAVYLQTISDWDSCVDIGSVFRQQCSIKDVYELACIRENVALNDSLFEYVERTLTPGMHELELWGGIAREMFVHSDVPTLLEGDLGGGKRGVDLGAQPSNAILETGDAVFIDIYSSHQGYYADTTRVFVLGEATKKQREIHAVLEEALLSAEELLKPGVAACQVDEKVRAVVTKHGYGDFFPHHTGHAYGLFQQEKPFIIPAERQMLEAGMVIAIEPGIYLPDWGGMRLERNYIIEPDGCVRMDRYPSTLTEIT